MSEKGAATVTGGNGLLIAGTVIALLLAVGAYLAMSDGDLTDVAAVSPAIAPATQQDEPKSVVSRTESENVATVPQTGDDVETSEQVISDDETSLDKTAGNDESVTDEEEQEAVETVAAKAPTIDEVRVDTSGTVVVAGRAEPGAKVDILLDGDVVTSAKTDSTGAFAALGTIDADDGARSLTLRAGEGDEAVSSVEEVILAPVPGPKPAEAEQKQEQTVDTAAAAISGSDTPMPKADVAQDEDVERAGDAVSTSQQPSLSALNAEQKTAPETSLDQDTDETVASMENVPSELDKSEEKPAEEAMAENENGTAQLTPSETETESGEIAILRSDESGVSLQKTAPTKRIVLDTIGYSDEGDVQLGGRAGSEAAVVRAYLNNRSVVQLPVDENGNWRGQVPDVDAGVYTLRIDEVSADGVVTSRLETPFKRETPEALAAANADAASGAVRAITVQAGDTLWAIARDRYGEGLLYLQVYDANRGSIRDPDLIYPGQVFELPSD